MLAALDQLESAALTELGAAGDAGSLEAWRIAYLGASGKLKAAMAGLKDVPKDQKPAVGQRLNAVKAKLDEAFAARKAELAAKGAGAPSETIDMTEPGVIESHAVGRQHVISRMRAELVEV